MSTFFDECTQTREVHENLHADLELYSSSELIGAASVDLRVTCNNLIGVFCQG